MVKTDRTTGDGVDRSMQEDLSRVQREKIRSTIVCVYGSLTALLQRTREQSVPDTTTESDLDGEMGANRAAAIAGSQEILTVTKTPRRLGFLTGTVLRAEITDEQRMFTLAFPKSAGIDYDFVIGPDFGRSESKERALFPQQPNAQTVGPASTRAFTEYTAEFIKSQTSRLNTLAGIRFSYKRVPKPSSGEEYSRIDVARVDHNFGRSGF